MANLYTDERNAQIIIYLLKKHGIKTIVASPGTTNVALVASMQIDPFFNIYSAPDERSGGYIACGLAAELGEPVVLSCTGATASRNYYPALTEAFYRKLPILVITSSRSNFNIGHNFDQVTDRTLLANDVAKLSVQMPVVKDLESEWGCVIAANKAILELNHKGGGPVHINLETTYSLNFNVKDIPPVRTVYRYTSKSIDMPIIMAENVAIVVGSHCKFDEELTCAVDSFCEKYNAVVICDQISNYRGKYRIFANLLTSQRNYSSPIKNVELVIHLGEITSSEYGLKPKSVWRVSQDGELRDTFHKLEQVFEIDELDFFEIYNSKSNKVNTTFFKCCHDELCEIKKLVPSLPFSNLWVASQMAPKLPPCSILHLGIRNSLRSWNFFETPASVLGYSNTGGFGIDGCLSTVLGASLAAPDKLFYCVLGDLAFFYDMNSLGNKHFGNNVRIVLINNGTGMEMRFTGFYADKIGAEKDNYISASGHYGNKSPFIVKHYTEDLGFDYYSAVSKEEFCEQLERILDPEPAPKPIIIEVFVNDKDEDDALTLLTTVKSSKTKIVKDTLNDVIGSENVSKIKKIFGK